LIILGVQNSQKSLARTSVRDILLPQSQNRKNSFSSWRKTKSRLKFQPRASSLQDKLGLSFKDRKESENKRNLSGFLSKVAVSILRETHKQQSFENEKE
jgi:hypothetical protein